MKKMKKVLLGLLATLMLFGGIFAYSANANEIQPRNNCLTWRTTTRTALYFGHQTGSSVLHTVPANRHVAGRGGMAITNNRRNVSDGGTVGWIHAPHLAMVNIVC